MKCDENKTCNTNIFIDFDSVVVVFRVFIINVTTIYCKVIFSVYVQSLQTCYIIKIYN